MDLVDKIFVTNLTILICLLICCFAVGETELKRRFDSKNKPILTLLFLLLTSFVLVPALVVVKVWTA